MPLPRPCATVTLWATQKTMERVCAPYHQKKKKKCFLMPVTSIHEEFLLPKVTQRPNYYQDGN